MERFETKGAKAPATTLAKIATPEMPEAKMRTRVERIDPDRAAHLLQKYVYTRQRGIRQNDVQRYADQMRRGLWMEGTKPIILAVLPDGRKFLVEGYHRLWAILEAGVTLTFEVTERLVETEEELNLFYSNIDRGRNRSNADMIKATALDEKYNLPVSILVKASSAITMIRADFRITGGRVNTTARAVGAEDRIKLLDEWQIPITHFYEAAGFGSNNRRCYAQPVLSVGLVTMRYQFEKAQDFWRRVVRGVDLAEGSPEHLVNRFIYIDTDRSSQGIYDLGPNIFAKKVAAAWNAFYDNVPRLTRLIVRDDTDIIINGTPWKWKRKEKEQSE